MSCRELLQFKTTSLFWLSKFAVTFRGDILGAEGKKSCDIEICYFCYIHMPGNNSHSKNAEIFLKGHSATKCWSSETFY